MSGRTDPYPTPGHGTEPDGYLTVTHTIDDVGVTDTDVSDGTAGPGDLDETETAGDQTGEPGFGPGVALVALLAAALLARREW